METKTDDVDYADIANLRKALAAPCSSDETNDDIEEFTEFENDIDITDEDNLDSSIADTGETSSDISYPLSYPHLDFDQVELIDGNVPSLRLCRALGIACFDMLYITEKQLKTLLEKCRTKINELQERIDSLKHPTDKATRGSWYYMFGIPYFKDRQYFPCPPNEDQLEKTANKELSIIDLPPLRQWKPRDKAKLESAVRSEEISIKIKEAKSKKASILRTLEETDDPEKIDELNQSLLVYDPAWIKAQPTAALVSQDRVEYDWMKISTIDLEGVHSPDECRAMWHNYLHPMIQKSKWTKDEDNKLKELVEKYDNQNWDEIARELGTQRSGYQCMTQYQQRLNDSIKKGKWTADEDEYLKEVVQRCRIGSYIPWAKVTYYMNGRSKNQVFNRWAYSLDPDIKKGRFTQQEDILVVAAVKRYGTDFPRVARFLPGRTSIQVRDRYNSYLKHKGSGEPWSQADDTLLLKLVENYGEGNWSQVCKYFENRSRTQVRHRFSTLQGWLQKAKEPTNNESDMKSAPTRRLNIVKNREEKVWNRVQAIFRAMKTTSMDVDENNLMKLKAKLNLDTRKRPGRKLGQKKLISNLDKDYYRFFRCVYAQLGGRKKLRFDAEVVLSNSQVIGSVLKHFLAHLSIPKDDSFTGDCLLEETDKHIARYFRDGVLPGDKGEDDAASGSNRPNMNMAIVSSLPPHEKPMIPCLCPPNHTTLLGFRTLLLSRRNIVIDSEARKTAEFEEDGASTSTQMSFDMARELWKERISSLFSWPAVMSNTFPSALKDALLSNNNESEQDSQDSESNSRVKTKTVKSRSKKRKFGPKKKKEVEIPQDPSKKRKYEKSGKFKKPSDSVAVRRSSRNRTEELVNEVNEEVVGVLKEEMVVHEVEIVNE